MPCLHVEHAEATAASAPAVPAANGGEVRASTETAAALPAAR